MDWAAMCLSCLPITTTTALVKLSEYVIVPSR